VTLFGSTITVQDLAEEEQAAASATSLAHALSAKGFAVLRPALAAESQAASEEEHRQNRREQAMFAKEVRKGEVAAAIRRFVQSRIGLRRLGFPWAVCTTPMEARASPAGAPKAAAAIAGPLAIATMQELLPSSPRMASALHTLLLRLPLVARLLKLWIPLRVPVQPIALMDGGDAVDPVVIAEPVVRAGVSPKARPTARHRSSRAKGDQDWWWHAELGLGDAVVLDALRCPYGPFTLPGEQSLARVVEDAQRLREAFLTDAQEDALRNASSDSSGNTSGGMSFPSLQEAERVCGGLGQGFAELETDDSEPYPAEGGRYTATTQPSTLVRALPNVESNIIAELPPGGVVTVLAYMMDAGVGRAMIYSEQAVAIQLESFGDSGRFFEDQGSTRATDVGITGWITSTGWHGERLLEPVAVPAAKRNETMPSPAIAARIADLASSLRGICTWVNVTAEKTRAQAGAQPGQGRGTKAAPPAWRVGHIRDRHAKALATQLNEQQRVAFEVQCFALAWPGEDHAAALVATLAAFLASHLAFQRWARERKHKTRPLWY